MPSEPARKGHFGAAVAASKAVPRHSKAPWSRPFQQASSSKATLPHITSEPVGHAPPQNRKELMVASGPELQGGKCSLRAPEWHCRTGVEFQLRWQTGMTGTSLAPSRDMYLLYVLSILKRLHTYIRIHLYINIHTYMYLSKYCQYYIDKFG